MRQFYFPLLILAGFCALKWADSWQTADNVSVKMAEQIQYYDEYGYAWTFDEFAEYREIAEQRSPDAARKGGRRSHRARHGSGGHAQDEQMPCGTPLSARQSGTVTVAGGRSGYGLTVAIDMGRCRAIYAHMSSVSVRVGQTVYAGAPIGRSGNTGRVVRGPGGRGCHLHYEGCSGLYGGGSARGGRRQQQPSYQDGWMHIRDTQTTH